MNQNKLFGTIGIAGAALLLLGVVIAIVAFENGAFSPLNGFYSELGQYPGAYMTGSSVLIFNVCMALFGLTLVVFMVFWGVKQGSGAFGAVAFFGILTGALAVAQAIFSLDYPKYHYIVAAAFCAAAFLFSGLYIAASLITGRHRSIAAVLVAFFAGVCSAIFAGYVISGGMTRVFVEDASQVGRLAFMPFAAVGWLALLLVMVLVALLGVGLIADRQMSRMSSLADQIRRTNSREIEF
jgi:hypothetical protein